MISPLPFRVDGHDLQIRAVSGREAYEAASYGNWLALMPEAVEGEGRDWLWERFHDLNDPLTFRSLWRIWHGLSVPLFGVEWWSVVRLARAREVNWLAFEGWTIRRGFEPDAPWVSPRRMTAALMAWMASSCDKEIEWQQIQVEVNSPPEYVAFLPKSEKEQAAGGMDISTFQLNAPAWARETPAAPEEGTEAASELQAPVREETAAAPPPWAGQPVMSMDDFAAQARQWVQGRGYSVSDEGAPPPV